MIVPDEPRNFEDNKLQRTRMRSRGSRRHSIYQNRGPLLMAAARSRGSRRHSIYQNRDPLLMAAAHQPAGICIANAHARTNGSWVGCHCAVTRLYKGTKKTSSGRPAVFSFACGPVLVPHTVHKRGRYVWVTAVCFFWFGNGLYDNSRHDKQH